MSEVNRYTTNPETGRRIRIGGVTYNRLVIESHDFINGELVRRETAPPPPLRQYFYNMTTGHSITYDSKRYSDLIRAGWEILDSYYLIPPDWSRLTQEDYEQIIATI